MADITSARVADLERFARRTEQAIGRLDADGRRLLSEYFEFQGRSDYPVVRDELIASFGAARRNWGDLALFTDLVAAALQAADDGAGGIHTVVDSVVTQQMAVEMGRRGLPPDALHSESVVVPCYALPPIPRTSGFVNDPVATATGYFVFDVHDLGRRAAEAGVTWRRVYGSGPSPAGSLGPGWSTWADCRVEADGDVLRYSGPDGLHAELVPDGHGGWLAPPWFEGTVTGDGAGGHLLAWHRWSPEVGAVWRFDDRGLLREARSARTTRTTFEHDGAGRLTAVVGSDGARATVTWSGDRIAEVAGPHLAVRYSYDDGLLVGVASARGDVRYDHDAGGRIVREIDADDVVHFVNDYDDDGRAVHQDVPGDGDAVFEHPDTTTLVVRGDATSIWRHDALRRLTNVSVPGAFRLERHYDDEGRIRSQRWNGSLTEVRRADDGSWTEISVDGAVRERFEHDATGRLVRHEGGSSELAARYEGGGDLPAELTVGETRYDLGWDDGRLVRVTDADGVVAELEHDDAGPTLTVRDTTVSPDVLGIERDDAGRIRVVAPRGLPRQELSYTEAGRLRSVRGTDGTRTEIEWDDDGLPVAIVGQGESTARFEWASSTRLRSFQDNGGPIWRFEHDQLGRLTGMTPDDGPGWTFAFEGAGTGAASVTGADGGTMGVLRDLEGRPSEVTTPLGNRWRVERDDAGRPTRVELPTGDVRTHVWDASGRPVETVDADGVRSTYEWSAAGRLLRSTVGDRVREVAYDEAGRPGRQIDGTGEVSQQWSDGFVAATTVDGVETRVDRDDAGRVVGLRRAGATWRFAYDEAGRVVEAEAPGSGVVRYAYGAGSRLDAVTDALGGRTSFAYDTAGRLTGAASPLGSKSFSRLDGYGRVTEAVDPLGRTTSYGYDPLGRLAWREEPDGRRTAWRRDADGGVVAVVVGDTDVARHERDALGRPVRIVEPASGSTTELTWSPEGRLLATAYDGAATRWQPASPGSVAGALHLADGRQIVSADGVRCGGAAVVVARDAYGRVEGIEVGSAGRTVERNGLGRVTATTWTATDGTARGQTVERDAAGKVVVEELDGVTVRYGYDAASQLVIADGPGGGTRFAYDADGRLVEETGPDGTREFTYDAAHQLLAAGDVSFEHDASGRRTLERGPVGERAYDWDDLGNLSRIRTGGGSVEIAHDPLGRVRSIDGQQVEWDLGAELPLPARVGRWALLRVDASVVAAVAGDGELRLPSPAAAGSDPWQPRETIELDGGVAVGRWGELLVAGLVLCGVRAYDPATRSFLTRDPLAQAAGHPASSNPYAFAANDPVNHADPDGREAVSIEQLEAYRQDVTGPQWGTIWRDVVAVGAVVAAVAITVGTGGAGAPLGAMVVGGAVAGGSAGLGGYVGDTVDDGTEFDVGEALVTTTVGAVVGAAGAGVGVRTASLVGSRITSSVLTQQVVSQSVGGAAEGLVTGLGGEVVDVAYGRPWDWSTVAQSTAFGAGGGALTGAVTAHVTPTTPGGGAVDSIVPAPATGQTQAIAGVDLLSPLPVAPVIHRPEFLVIERTFWTPPAPEGFVHNGTLLVPEGAGR